ncbi:MAG TPA: mandelate racemase/muconate lactonizing enzyme family protein, partial [Micromonosporaceae bacterium]
ESIRCVDVFGVDNKISTPAGPAGVTYDTRSSVLVRLEDSDGHVGWGETYRRPGVIAVLDELADRVLGRSASERRRLLDDLSGPDRFAVSALAIAVDDLRARQLGVPVSDLYGGRRRDSVRAYASSGGYRDDLSPEQSWPAEFEAVLTDGYRAAKFRIGRYSPVREIPALRELRTVAGPDFDLMVDANGAYSVPTAIRIGRALEELQFRWFEEPLTRFRNGLAYPGYEQLSRLDIAIAAGEGLDTRSAFEAFLARGAATIVQPDVAICGGIDDALFVAELAALRGRPCVPHAWGGGILLAATLQLLSVMRDPSEVAGFDSPVLEVDRLENPLRTDVWGGEVRPIDGVVAVPTGPGLGVSVDDDYIRRAASVRRHHTSTTQ